MAICGWARRLLATKMEWTAKTPKSLAHSGMFKTLHIRLTWAALAWFAAASCTVAAEPLAAWKTGPAFRRQLDSKVSLTWPMRGLRAALMTLSQNMGVAIFLDRQIDPDQILDLVILDQTLEEALERIAKAAGADAQIMGAVVYIGPERNAARLTTLAAIRRQEASLTLGEAKARLLHAQAWQWEELAEPRKLLDEMAREARVTIENPEAVPHDLWAHASLPPLPWTDRMTLLLAGFNLTFQVSGAGERLRLIPIPEMVALTKTYTPRGTATEVVTQLRRIVPSAEIRKEGSKLIVVGTAEEHDKVERLLSGESVRTTKAGKGPGQKVYSLTVQKNTPAGAVLQTIAKQTGKELKYDPALLPKLKENVDLSVKDVSLEELLTATLQPLGLGFRVTESSIEVVSKE